MVQREKRESCCVPAGKGSRRQLLEEVHEDKRKTAVLLRADAALQPSAGDPILQVCTDPGLLQRLSASSVSMWWDNMT